MTFVIDIDNTLLKARAVPCDECGRFVYETPVKIDKAIKEVNKMYEKGHKITLWTGRGWGVEKATREQLNLIGVKYHNLIMGKPLGVYIDADSYKSISEYQLTNKE